MKKAEVIKINKKRYRLSTIKFYEPVTNTGNMLKPGILISTSTAVGADKFKHSFKTSVEREEILTKLDSYFGLL